MSRRKTTEEFINDAIAVHGDRYDYSLVEYTRGVDKIKIICKEHGVFEQRPNDHTCGCGCSACGKEKMIISQCKTEEIFINDAIDIHGDIYDYSLIEYKNSHTKVKIICPIHGIFDQQPHRHLTSGGCYKCGQEKVRQQNIRKRKTTKHFIEESKKVHGDVYDYSLVKYKGNKTKVNIICDKHGIFNPQPSNHLKGSKCPKCAIQVSKPETQWLDSIGLPNDCEHRQVKIGNYKVDGFEPITNTVYEFHGDFWHGNPKIYKPIDINQKVNKSYGQLHKETTLKESFIKQSGYKLIVMWESDWKKHIASMAKKP